MAKLTWNPPALSKRLCKFAWAADYAADVWLGQNDKGFPSWPRRWTDEAIAVFNPERIFADSFRVTNDLDRSFVEMCDEFDDLLREAIESDIYYWGGTTFRQNGDVVGSPRDIVDTGNLRDSQFKRFF